jgi:hypothetical protein
MRLRKANKRESGAVILPTMPDGVGRSLILNHLPTVQPFQTLRGSKPMAAQFIEREHSPHKFSSEEGMEGSRTAFSSSVFLITK